LVAGAWSGAWAWDDVVTGLKAKGAVATAVELPAHGADTTALQGATLDAYVAKVAAAVDAEGAPVVLVGHSMAGVVISEVAEQKADKIAQLVYLAAFFPKDGDTLQGLSGSDSASHLGPALVIDPQKGTAAVPSDKLADIFCADCGADEMSKLSSRYRDEPLAPFGAPVHVTAAAWGKVAKSYIYTKKDNAVSPALQQRMTTGITFVKTATLDSSHSPFLSHATDLTSTLVDIAAARTP
jgi:pimeloyl-ACP methyl ester carboxylesterase